MKMNDRTWCKYCLTFTHVYNKFYFVTTDTTARIFMHWCHLIEFYNFLPNNYLGGAGKTIVDLFIDQCFIRDDCLLARIFLGTPPIPRFFVFININKTATVCILPNRSLSDTIFLFSPWFPRDSSEC